MNSAWTEVFLGVIAVATLATAIIQIIVLVEARLLARRVGRLVDRVEEELTPLFGQLNAIAREGARAAALATTQIERADRLFADGSRRIEQMLATVQATLVAPAREGRALIHAFRAGLLTVLDVRAHARRRARSEDDDALFI